MAARPLQPSEYEIQREVEALKDLRRRSTNPAALTIDPDLPNQPSQTSPTSPYRSKRLFNSSDVVSVESSGRIDTADQAGASGSGQGDDTVNGPSDDPFHLFWVPASLHPEIAPAEFRAFLKEHAKSSPSEESASLGRSFSSSSSLSRKKSMLSRQYKPNDTDGDEEESVVPVKRSRSFYRNEGPHLTISDLQKLEELAEEASQSDDPSKLRNVLRRSLSLNVSPTAVLLDDLTDMDEDADAPIVVPPRDKALRRTARTKIRKAGLPGDGGGHRFASSRRNKKASQPPVAEPRTSSDLSTSDHGEVEHTLASGRRTTLSEERPSRPESGYSEEQSILDAYVGQDDDGQRLAPKIVPLQSLEPFSISLDPPATPDAEVMASQPENTHEPPVSPPVLHQPQPQRLTVPHSKPEQGSPSRTPSPSPLPEPQRFTPVFPNPAPPGFVQSSPNLLLTPKKEKEKDKKGLFKWGDKSGKKANKDKDRPPEKESGFLFSIFGKKRQDSEYQSSMTGGAAGREAAQALLGASKSSKLQNPLSSPGLAPGIGGNPYARYPIHVERAIYRLSHIKLANPRRPLYEQVLISNLMFWYLGIINKAQNPTSPPAQANGPAVANTSHTEKHHAEKEVQERQQREKVERENIEQERSEKERLEKEREIEMKKKESGRRGSLTKSPVGTLPAGARRAEIPVKGPQYEVQHRVMEQEYGGYSLQQSRSPPSPAPPVMNGGAPGRRPPQAASVQPTQEQPVQMGPTVPGRQPGRPIQPGQMQPVVPQSKASTEQYYYSHESYHPQPRPGLPPGAMPPVDKQIWMSQTNPPLSPPRRTPSPNPQARSEPLDHFLRKQTSQEILSSRNGVYNKGPMRSLSATASTLPPGSSPQLNGDLNRSITHTPGTSVHPKRPRTADGVPQVGEEEDVPLAVWQQQQRCR